MNLPDLYDGFSIIFQEFLGNLSRIFYVIFSVFWEGSHLCVVLTQSVQLFIQPPGSPGSGKVILFYRRIFWFTSLLVPGYCEQGASEHSPVYEAASFSCAGTVPSLALASCLAPAFSLSICLDSVLQLSMIVEMSFIQRQPR